MTCIDSTTLRQNLYLARIELATFSEADVIATRPQVPLESSSRITSIDSGWRVLRSAAKYNVRVRFTTPTTNDEQQLGCKEHVCDQSEPPAESARESCMQHWSRRTSCRTRSSMCCWTSFFCDMAECSEPNPLQWNSSRQHHADNDSQQRA